jgi:hypothetical protein
MIHIIHDLTILITLGVLLQYIETIIVSEESERNDS